MDTDAARGALERPSGAPPGASRDAPVASTSDPEVGTGAPHVDAIESMTFPAFPHEPYGIQLELMRSLYATLRRGGIGVFESPTGTGKTLSVLCSALQWLEDERRANARGASSGDETAKRHESSRSAQLELADEPDWLRDFASNKRGRDAADREQRRKARRAEARRRAAEADRAFFAGARSVGQNLFGGKPEAFFAGAKGSAKKSKAAAEAAAVAAYAAAVSRGASRDDAIEEAEFLAEDWSDETGAVAPRAARGDDTSSDEEADFVSTIRNAKRFKRVGKSGARAHTEKLVGVDASDSDEDDFPPTQVIFCSRTHSQLTQVVGELRSTAFGRVAGESGEEDNLRLVSAVAVAGRRQLCVNRDALETAGASASRLNERCLELAEEGRKAGRKAGGGAKKETTSDGRGGRGGRGGRDDDESKKEKEKGCPFLRKRRGAVAELAEEALATPMDIEDLASAGVKRRACPYYAARAAHPRADLIFAPYASLLHAETRDSLGVRLKDAVVVFDEAHNLAEAVHGAHGASVTGAQLDAVFGMVDAYTERFYSRLSPGNLRHLKTLKTLCAAFKKSLDVSVDATPSTLVESGSGNPSTVKVSTVKTLNDFLFDAGADAVNVFALTKYLKESKIAHKIAGYGEHARRAAEGVEDNDPSAKKESTNWDWEDGEIGDDVDLGVAAVVRAKRSDDGTKKKNPRVGSVHAMAAFVSALAAADADGRVLVEKNSKDSNDRDDRGGRLKFVLLDAAARFKTVVDNARAVVLVGGTLSPIDELAAQLFPDCERADATTKKRDEETKTNEKQKKALFSLSLGHVVPRDALLPLAVARGPSGLALDFSFGARDADTMVDELGRVVLNACAVSPGGVVVFFPSFAYADRVYDRWTSTGVTARIARLKTVFREPRAAADVEKALRSFSDAVARFGADGANGPESKNATQTGALMLCVCGGKLSEGINFKDALGRLVVMVGLPYANPEEPELKARMRYLDERGGGFGADPDAPGSSKNNDATTKTRGRRYYEALCMRSVNQSVGRAIRHVGDYAAILFCDRRYAPSGADEPPRTRDCESEKKKELRGVPAQLAGWIGERLVTPSGYGQTQAGLARFFAGKRKK